ncbi:serine hydrolase domain-containing protein [Sphingobacterium sp. GVS05A]|uniref:serine hydrolase domain-containing protein n=1 Tax=Sphingobacterium sp. GVS05A TaxID=2862679 RepID=UPI001CC01189|nr:serine hydrolase domain-containing protein [Sphingobacterium sp. GVS05A]
MRLLTISKNISALIVLFAYLGNTTLVAQQKLDAYFAHLFQNNKMMGTVAVLYNDSLYYATSIGYADVDSKRKNDSNTKFRIASNTKTYTAVLILKAVEEQKLSLDTYLSTFYPQIKNAEKITIEQLLKHRSGIFNFTEIKGEEIWEQEFHTEAEFVSYIENEKSNFEPNTAYEYSNTNYALLGFILEKVYDKSYAALLNEKICEPLKLRNTYFSTETDPNKHEAISYNIQNRYIENSKVNFSNHPASGGIATTAIELNRFLSGLFEGRLISKESLALMLPENKGEYGMGIEKARFKNPIGYIHGGRIENYFSDYWYFPAEKLGIVTLCNAVNINLSQVQNTLIQYVYGRDPILPDFNKTKDLTEEQFRQIAGTYRFKDGGQTMTISSDGTNLIGQLSENGQMYVPYHYKSDHTFVYDDEGSILEFIPGEQSVLLKDGDLVLEFKKI